MHISARKLVSAAIVLAVILAGLKVVSIVTAVPQPPLPPLLTGVAASGGSTSVCSADTQKPSEQSQLAWSPELNRRLERDFPPGAEAKNLTAELQRLGFKTLGACPGDSTIRSALFQQHGGFLLRPGGLPITATIWWKVDPGEQHLVWAKGIVFFDGL